MNGEDLLYITVNANRMHVVVHCTEGYRSGVNKFVSKCHRLFGKYQQTTQKEHLHVRCRMETNELMIVPM